MGEVVDKSETQDNWCTPPTVRDPIVEYNGGRPIALDPATNPGSIMGARTEWYGLGFEGICDSKHLVNGLAADWSVAGRNGLVFFNPPFSDKYNWVWKASNEDSKFRRRRWATEIIGLVPVDSDTQWFQDVARPSSSAQCFWKGRLVFLGDKPYPARFPVVLFYWGPRARQFKAFFSDYGWCP